MDKQIHPYVSKTNYINSFSLPKSLWFIDETKIQDEIYNQIRIIYQKQAEISGVRADSDLIIDQNEDNEIDDDHDINIDLDQILELDLNNLDNITDAKLLEGQWIYDNFINYFKNNHQFYDYKIIDYFKEFKFHSIEQKTEYIFKYYLSQSKIIIFKPLFISKNKAKAVPHAIIKNGDNIIICEAFASKKINGTQTLSLIYDYHVINDCLISHNLPKINDYKIFLVESTKQAKKNTLPLIQCDCLCWRKSPLHISEIKDTNHFYLNDLVRKNKNKLTENFIDYFDENKFWQKIDEIYQTQITNTIDLNPSECFIYGMKTNQTYKSQLKQLWSCSNNWHFIGYSGNLWNMKKALMLEKIFNNFFATKIKLDLKNVIAHLKFIQSNHYNILECQSDKKKKNIFNLQSEKWTYILNAINQANEKLPYFIPNQCKIHFKKLKNKKIYFDFESICLAKRPMDNIDAFQQICTQVSIIRDLGTIKDPKKMSKTNLVFDPGSKYGLTPKNMEQIVDALLDGINIDKINDYSFVVYNKNFEIPRLKEMKEIINKKSYSEKIDLIINNVFDLADCFNITTKSQTGCFIWQVKGFYSIKYVLNFIMNNDFAIYKYVGCLNYKEDLNVHNGVDAQNITTLRFYGKIADDEWEKIEIDLKKYCENDVKSMIALEYWLRSKCNE